MGMWADEEGSYDASTESGAGHFTQMVWKGTTSIGCAIQTSCDLADYDPKFWVSRHQGPSIPAGVTTTDTTRRV